MESTSQDETLPATAGPWPTVALAGLAALAGAAALRKRRG
jgi:MYXO-CTERM domain-containing protein